MQVTPSDDGGLGGQKQMDVLFVDISGVCPASPALPINLSEESLLLPPVHLILILRQSFKAGLYKYLLVKLIIPPDSPRNIN